MTQHSPIEIRQLTNIAEFSSAVRLQREIWGFDDIELLPLRLFVVASKIGGLVLGAFDIPAVDPAAVGPVKMVAFCLAVPGLKPGGKFYLHSHMLGVLSSYRNTGLGRALKLKQREYAIGSGIDLIEWTFDPLEIKNAFFNIQRLGAVVRRYVYNQYGSTSSHLHGGLPTDRLVAEWWIQSARSQSICKDEPLQTPEAEARISVPAEIAILRGRDPRRAREIQASIGEQFNQYFRNGLTVIGFEKNENTGTYLLGQWESK